MKTEARNAAEREEALATPRHIDAEFYYPGAGVPLVRLAWLPSFDVPILWEVRSVDGTLTAFRSYGEPNTDEVVGHEKLAVDDVALRQALDGIALTAVPLVPSVEYMAVADGAEYVATVYRALRASCRFSWSDGYEPKAWAAAVEPWVRLRRLLDGDAPTLPARFAPVYVWSSTSTANLVRLDTGEFQVWDPVSSARCLAVSTICSRPISLRKH